MPDSLTFRVPNPDPQADAYWWRIQFDDSPAGRFATPEPTITLPKAYFPPDTVATVQVQAARSSFVELSGWSEPIHMVPEPSASLLLVAGLVGLALIGRGRRG